MGVPFEMATVLPALLPSRGRVLNGMLPLWQRPPLGGPVIA